YQRWGVHRPVTRAVTTIVPGDLDERAAYRLAMGVVVPRPIAWVTTLNESGSVNLAPFSCYTAVSYSPFMVGINISPRASGLKDTAAYMVRSREFVLNVVHESQAEPVHRSSEAMPTGVSETEMLGLATHPSDVIGPPRLADAPAALECRLHDVIAFGDAGSRFYVGTVEVVHLREGLYRDGKVATAELEPLARIAGPN